MSINNNNTKLFERKYRKTAKIVYKRFFGYTSTESEGCEIRFCGEIFRSKYVAHSQIKRMPPLQKF